MSSTQLTTRPAQLPHTYKRVHAGWVYLAADLPLATGAALLLVVLYAAFAHGAVSDASGTRVELAVSGLCAVASVCWVWTRSLRPAAVRSAVVGVALLAAFACWSGITVLWSVAPNQTWLELNRAIAYTLVVVLGIGIGASRRGALALAATGFLTVASIVTLYGLGQKLAPGLHIPGLFNLDQTGCARGEPLQSCPLPRLQEPLGYWNALALFIALAVPAALAVAADVTRDRAIRLSALCTATLMLVTISYTYSRGGLLALAVGLVVLVGASRQRLRSLMWTAVSVLAAIPAMVVGLTLHQLTSPTASLASREQGGAVLAGVLVLALGVLVLVARRLLVIEPRVRVQAGRANRLRRLLIGAAATLIVIAVAALALSSRGLSGTITHAWNSFTATHAASNSAPSHLLSADSQNRWVWWEEAAGAFSDRPLGGWGAGSFGVVHLLYRRNTLPVQQPHSVPLQFLAETGIVGALLALAAYVLLMRAGVLALRRVPRERDRLLAAALVAAGAAYGVHCLYDWDWNIPALTLPVMMFLGVLAGAGARAGPGARPLSVRHLAPPSLGRRAAALVMLTLWLSVFALSVELPELAAAKASAALVQAGTASPRALAAASSSAALATRLDPLSDQGEFAEAAVALHQGRAVLAGRHLAAALRREPTDERVWRQLWYVDSLLGDPRDALLALHRVVELDPYGPAAAEVARAELDQAPPWYSPSAIRTPPARGRSQ